MWNSSTASIRFRPQVFQSEIAFEVGLLSFVASSKPDLLFEKIQKSI